MPDFIMKNLLTREMELRIIAKAVETVASSGQFAARKK